MSLSPETIYSILKFQEINAKYNLINLAPEKLHIVPNTRNLKIVKVKYSNTPTLDTRNKINHIIQNFQKVIIL